MGCRCAIEAGGWVGRSLVAGVGLGRYPVRALGVPPGRVGYFAGESCTLGDDFCNSVEFSSL